MNTGWANGMRGEAYRFQIFETDVFDTLHGGEVTCEVTLRQALCRAKKFCYADIEEKRASGRFEFLNSIALQWHCSSRYHMWSLPSHLIILKCTQPSADCCGCSLTLERCIADLSLPVAGPPADLCFNTESFDILH